MNNTNQSARRRFDADFAVSARIRQMRNLLGRSQMDVAAALGLTFQQLQKYEKAQNRISAGRLHQLAVEYSCPVAWFFGNYDNSGATPLKSLIFCACCVPAALKGGRLFSNCLKPTVLRLCSSKPMLPWPKPDSRFAA